LTLANCLIVNHTNSANGSGYGAGGSFTAGSVFMTNCLVANNAKSGYSSYGFGIYSSGANMDIVDCVFSNQSGDSWNARTGYGSGLAFDNGALRVVRTIFVGNQCTDNGGGGTVLPAQRATIVGFVQQLASSAPTGSALLRSRLWCRDLDELEQFDKNRGFQSTAHSRTTQTRLATEAQSTSHRAH